MDDYMKDVSTFKSYMTNGFKPRYLVNYVNSLNEEELNWFYEQMKEPLEFLTTESYLFYKLKWILKNKFTDLSKEIYAEYLCNPEGFTFTIIKPEWEPILEKRYYQDFFKW